MKMDKDSTFSKLYTPPAISNSLWVPLPHNTPADIIPASLAVFISIFESPTNKISEGLH